MRVQLVVEADGQHCGEGCPIRSLIRGWCAAPTFPLELVDGIEIDYATMDEWVKLEAALALGSYIVLGRLLLAFKRALQTLHQLADSVLRGHPHIVHKALHAWRTRAHGHQFLNGVRVRTMVYDLLLSQLDQLIVASLFLRRP